MKMNKNIIIKNIYYMLTYAFQSLVQSDYKDVELEEFDEIHNLFSAILSKGLSYLLKQGLYREYINNQENLSTVRGKINLTETINNRIAHRQMINCEYDEFSENNIYNQIIKSTVFLLIKCPQVKPKYKDELKKKMLYFSNVDLIDLAGFSWAGVRFQRNNQTYRMLINICQLVAEGMLLTTDSGEYTLESFVDEQHMHRLYEKFILEYYIKNYPYLSVSSSQIKWSLDDGVGTLLPTMQSDIMIQKGNNVLIIDAKYYNHSLQHHYDNYSIHSSNLYQIFTYVKNKDYELENYEHKVSGLLLYAKTTEKITPNSDYKIHGNDISVRSLDLNKPFKDIENQLDNIIKKYF